MKIVSTRLFDFPRGAVFGAFEDPARLAVWWGPNGFTNTIREFDFRAGGKWRLVMRSAEGAEFDNESEFIEVQKPKKIVYRHLRPMHCFLMTMTYDEAPGGKTRLTWRMDFEETPENEKLKPFLENANQQNFDRLAAVLGARA